MLTFYPPIKPYADYRIAVDDIHEIYVEECGNPDGLPVLFVHGGPGAGFSERDRTFFDPSIYRVVLFDQRGCGRSTPHAELKNNNTQALVSDMETIRERLKIDRWLLFGGSWGSTLSLVYAQAYPERVKGLILRGIFLNRPEDIEWLYMRNGANQIYPDYWEDFIAPIPSDQRGHVIDVYYDLLNGDDEIARMAAAKAWATWEARCATLLPNKKIIDYLSSPHVALSIARLECHYFINNCFLEPHQIMREIHRIRYLPAVIVHGRYDMVCPLDNAWELHRAWPNSQLKIIADAGHSSVEPGIVDALINATQQMAKTCK